MQPASRTQSRDAPASFSWAERPRSVSGSRLRTPRHSPCFNQEPPVAARSARPSTASAVSADLVSADAASSASPGSWIQHSTHIRASRFHHPSQETHEACIDPAKPDHDDNSCNSSNFPEPVPAALAGSFDRIRTLALKGYRQWTSLSDQHRCIGRQRHAREHLSGGGGRSPRSMSRYPMPLHRGSADTRVPSLSCRRRLLFDGLHLHQRPFLPSFWRCNGFVDSSGSTVRCGGSLN